MHQDLILRLPDCMPDPGVQQADKPPPSQQRVMQVQICADSVCSLQVSNAMLQGHCSECALSALFQHTSQHVTCLF